MSYLAVQVSVKDATLRYRIAAPEDRAIRCHAAHIFGAAITAAGLAIIIVIAAGIASVVITDDILSGVFHVYIQMLVIAEGVAVYLGVLSATVTVPVDPESIATAVWTVLCVLISCCGVVSDCTVVYSDEDSWSEVLPDCVVFDYFIVC